MNLLSRLFDSDGFMPHGHCYLWNPSLVWLHVISDSLIAAAYLTIPITLGYIARKRKDLPFDWMFACFGVFILACGATHLLEVWTLWTPAYWLSGAIKAVTAAASVATALLLVKLVPRMLAIPGIETLRRANDALQREIAERIRAEEALRAANEKLQTIFDAAPVAILAGDLTGKLTTWSAGAERMFGWTAEQAIGQTCPTVPEDGRREFHAMLHRVVQEGPQTGMVASRQRKGGERFQAGIAAAPLCDAAGQRVGVMVILEDITQRLAASAARDEFLSRMSHELRTPLHAILGFGQLIEADRRDPETADNVRQILTAGQRLLALVDEALDFSRLATDPVEQ